MSDSDAIELAMDGAQLYREEIFTDRRIGTIRQLVPVKADGSPDPSRATTFAGQTQILTAGGVLPLSFEIPAGTLDEAVRGFGAAAKAALEETMRELQELRREAASQLVIPEPGTTASILGPGGMLPRGGKPRLR
ncbi:MAG TPA: hypothetical protein VKW76_00540 [Candidatus Binatia bacterium]|nr:hypothetical protein [Candidatus Binatia bacterium]